MMKELLLAALTLAGAQPQAQVESPQERTRLPIGMNLSVVSAANREIVFVDAFKSASHWQISGLDERPGFHRPGTRPPARRRELAGDSPGAARGQRGAVPSTESKLEFGRDGWPILAPGQVVMGQIFASMDGHYPAGTYVCTWSGSGEVDFQRAARVTKRGERRLEMEVDPTRGPIIVRFEVKDAADPIRDIRLWLPGFEDAESSFHPLFLERLRPFQVIRFGNWMRAFTNTGLWDARTRATGLSQSGRNGVALEYMLELCNELGSSPWFCMPHLADEEYVRGFARRCRDGLRTDLPIYVEFSNEAWNDIFPQARWARDQAHKRGLRAGQVIAEAAAAQWKIWYEVFGDGKARIVRVAAGQLHNPSVARVQLETLGGGVDALAVGAYFGVRPDQEGFDRHTSADEIMLAARRNLETIVLQRIQEHARLAQQAGERAGHDIALLAYEGGQHIVAKKSLGRPDQRLALSPAAVAACQVSAAMYDAYRTLLAGCRRAGVELFVAYDLAGKRLPGDSFGHLEYLDQPLEHAPKYRALVADWGVGPQRAEAARSGHRDL